MSAQAELVSPLPLKYPEIFINMFLSKGFSHFFAARMENICQICSVVSNSHKRLVRINIRKHNISN